MGDRKRSYSARAFVRRNKKWWLKLISSFQSPCSYASQIFDPIVCKVRNRSPYYTYTCTYQYPSQHHSCRIFFLKKKPLMNLLDVITSEYIELRLIYDCTIKIIEGVSWNIYYDSFLAFVEQSLWLRSLFSYATNSVSNRSRINTLT